MKKMKGIGLIIVALFISFLLAACNDADTQSESQPTAVSPTQPAAAETVQKDEAAETETAVSQPTDQPTAAAAAEADQAPIYLAIIWHQHQPIYYKDPATNIYIRPWVRMHAAKDYVDMAAILEAYPNVRATYNLTPSLIRQLDDLAAGAKDSYWTIPKSPPISSATMKNSLFSIVSSIPTAKSSPASRAIRNCSTSVITAMTH